MGEGRKGGKDKRGRIWKTMRCGSDVEGAGGRVKEERKRPEDERR